MRLPLSRQDTIKIVIVVLLFIAIFAPTFNSLIEKFLAADSYYSHGFLIPVVCAYLVWRKRKKLKALPIESSKIGPIVLIGGLLLHIVSSILKINFGSYLSIIVVLEGLILYLLGKKINRELLFPLVFLIFMVPLPSVIIIGISFKMKIFVAHIASSIANQIGISATRDGSTIFLPNGKLIVGDPCSGLRSLISLLALGAVFTQFIKTSVIKKNTLLLSAIPIALFSNLLRIIILLLATYIYGEKVTLGFLHDFSGMLVFVFAISGLVLTARILKCQIAQENT